MLRCCLNPKVLLGLAVAAGAVLLLAPDSLTSALPLLVGLVCPLSMLLMMRAMRHNATPDTPAGTVGAPESEEIDVEIESLRAQVAQLRARAAESQQAPTAST